jgi:hypothetical protein
VAEIGKAVYDSPLFKSTTPSTKSAFASALRAGDIQRALALSAGFVGGQGLDDEYGHDPAIHAAVDDAFAKANGNPMVARQLLHAQEAVYVNPDGTEIRVPHHVVSSFVNAIPNTNLQHADTGVAPGNAQGGQAPTGRQAGTAQEGMTGGDTLSDMLFGASANAAERPQATKPAATSAPSPAIAKAQAEMDRDGITAEQRAAYRSGMSEKLFKAFDPTEEYDDANFVKREIEKARRRLKGEDVGDERDPKVNDAWRLYLGLPQQHGTFSVSPYTPGIKKDGAEPYYYRINNFWRSFLDEDDSGQTDAPKIRALIAEIDGSEGGRLHFDADMVMREYTVMRSKDARGPYISIYDIWDLAPVISSGGDEKAIRMEKYIGRPFEIYDRLYYDPKTFAPRFENTSKEKK